MSLCGGQQHYVEQESTDDFSFNPNIPNKFFEKLLTEATFYTSDSFKFKVGKSRIWFKPLQILEKCILATNLS